MRLCVRLLISSNFRRYLCSSDSSTGLPTVKDAISHWTKVFKRKEIPEPEVSIENIMAHVLGYGRISEMYSVENETLTEKQIEFLEKCCDCRLARMPVQYIIREWDFRSLNLKMSPPVFIPRPETEELVDVVLNYVKKENLTPNFLLEVGCGSGAVILSLITELPQIMDAFAIDKSKMACILTETNARILMIYKLHVINAELKEEGIITLPKTDIDPLPNKKFDIIVSNPPYVPHRKLPELDLEIKLYEDLRAIDGGPDGMKLIKPLMIYASKSLSKNGSLFMEIDETHPELIKKWIESHGDEYKLTLVKIHKDVYDKQRFVHIIRK